MGKFKRIWATKNPNDEWWSSFVTSPLAVVCNWLVVDIAWITPNLITLFSFIVAACGSNPKPRIYRIPSGATGMASWYGPGSSFASGVQKKICELHSMSWQPF